MLLVELIQTSGIFCVGRESLAEFHVSVCKTRQAALTEINGKPAENPATNLSSSWAAFPFPSTTHLLDPNHLFRTKRQGIELAIDTTAVYCSVCVNQGKYHHILFVPLVHPLILFIAPSSN